MLSEREYMNKTTNRMKNKSFNETISVQRKENKMGNKMKIVEFVGKGAIEFGVSQFAANVAMATMPAGIGVACTVLTKVGARLLGSAAGEYTADWTVDKIKEINSALQSGDFVNVIF